MDILERKYQLQKRRQRAGDWACTGHDSDADFGIMQPSKNEIQGVFRVLKGGALQSEYILK